MDFVNRWVVVWAMQLLKQSLRLPATYGWNGDPCVPLAHIWFGVDCRFNNSATSWFIDGLYVPINFECCPLTNMIYSVCIIAFVIVTKSQTWWLWIIIMEWKTNGSLFTFASCSNLPLLCHERYLMTAVQILGRSRSAWCSRRGDWIIVWSPNSVRPLIIFPCNNHRFVSVQTTWEWSWWSCFKCIYKCWSGFEFLLWVKLGGKALI